MFYLDFYYSILFSLFYSTSANFNTFLVYTSKPLPNHGLKAIFSAKMKLLANVFLIFLFKLSAIFRSNNLDIVV